MILYVVAAVLLYIVFYGLYNAYLHPLAKYPGPLLWTAYRLPWLLQAWQGRLPRVVLDIHRRYGPIVRIAPDELAFLDAGAWDNIYGLQPGRRQNKKIGFNYSPVEPGEERQIIRCNDTNHTRLRRLYGPAFTTQAVEGQAEMLLKYSNLLVSSMKTAMQTSPVLDMSKWFNYATFDLTGEFAFGEEFHCLDQGGKNHFFVETVIKGTTIGFKLGQLERYGIWQFLSALLPKSAMQARIDMYDYTRLLIDRRVERGFLKGHHDVFNSLLENQSEQDRLKHDELVENGVVLVVAGSETTATALAGVTWFLCTNPEVYERVKNEVRHKFSSDDQITPNAVSNLSYLRAVLMETLRRLPPLATALPRKIVTPGGISVAGYHVPEQTLCSVHHWSSYHSEYNFTRPFEFLPERWLADAPMEFANDNYKVMQPFHVGPRDCLGKNLAHAEMRLLLAKMIWHFDFELANPNDKWYDELKGQVTWVRDPLNIRVTTVKR